MKSAIIKRQLVSEKTAALAAENKYVFAVAKDADKKAIAAAVAAAFNVTVEAVHIINVLGKRHSSRTIRGAIVKAPDVKKAIVTLKEGDKIELN